MIRSAFAALRSSTTAVVTVTGFLAVFVATSVLALVSYVILAGHVADGAAERQTANIRVAATVFERDLPGTRVEWAKNGLPRIVMPQIPAFEDHRTVDAVSRVTGDTTTLFAYEADGGEFVRRSTNVLKPDGSRAVGTVLGRNGVVHPVVARGDTFSGIVDILGVPYSTTYVPVFSPEGKVVGIVYSGVKKAVVDGLIREWTLSIVLAGGVVLALSAVVLFLVGRRITRPLVDLSAALRRVSDGDLAVDVPHRDRRDEVGAVARTVDDLRAAAAERQALATAQEREHAARAATQTRITARIADFRRSIAGLRAALGRDVDTMNATARELAGLADEATRRAESATRATEEASAGVRAVADSAGDLAGSVAEIDRRAAAAAAGVADARRAAEESSTRIARLSDASTRIGAVLDLIRDIADQTNLLALNATIEAARAGEAGRGFAVVASEVKTLAGQTAKATDEIGAQIGAVRAEVEAAVAAIAVIGGKIGETAGYTEAIAEAVGRQSLATSDISRSADGAARGTAEAAEGVAGVGDVAARTDAAAERVSGLSRELDGCSRDLGAEIDRFLADVAA